MIDSFKLIAGAAIAVVLIAAMLEILAVVVIGMGVLVISSIVFLMFKKTPEETK
jgi:hypothetical protein